MVIGDFYIWFVILLVSFLIVLFGYLNFSNKSDIFNNFFGFSALSFVFIHILLVLFLMFQVEDLHVELLPVWLMTLGLPIILIGVVVIISTTLVNLYRIIFKKKNGSVLEKKIQKKFKVISKLRRDLYRKIPHALIFIGLFIVWYVGVDIVTIVKGEFEEGMTPAENNMLYLYLQLLRIPNSVQKVLFKLGWFYYLLFFFFYTFCLVIIANEFARKTRYASFPFKIFTYMLSEEERQGYGCYLYFAIGQMLASFVVPPMVCFAILGMSAISDLMASQVGIKFGKKHVKWNDDKTWEGALAGFLTSLAISYLFMGIIWALIFSIAFLIFDILTKKPLNMSDNLLNPIGCSFIYVFLRFFLNLDFYTIVLEWV